jgi:hypothetical protein
LSARPAGRGAAAYAQAVRRRFESQLRLCMPLVFIKEQKRRRFKLRITEPMAALLRWTCSERAASLPREPARRTIQALLKRRWIKKTGQGRCQVDITPAGRRALDEHELPRGWHNIPHSTSSDALYGVVLTPVGGQPGYHRRNRRHP